MVKRRSLRLPAVLLLLLAACIIKSPSANPYLRVTGNTGRLYYTRDSTTLITRTGYLAFRDLVTGEEVKLRGGTYRVEECSRAEVEVRQLQWLEHPTRVPVRSDAPGLAPEDQQPGPPAVPG